MRFLVLLFFGLCILSVVKVALLRWKSREGVPPAPSAVWEADGQLRAYPTAEFSRWKDIVHSPYEEGVLLDVSGHPPGQLIRCGASRLPFYVPLAEGLDYGEIVGDWTLERRDREGTTEYQVRLLAELDGVTGQGRRVKSEGLPLGRDEQPTLVLTGRFEGDHLVCEYEEHLAGKASERGLFRWAFSSKQDSLHGEAQTPCGLIHSEGKRTAGSRGQIPASGFAAAHFVPAGWRLLDTLKGDLAPGDRGGEFLVLVMEEDGALGMRWLVLAQRRYAKGEFQTVLISPNACLAHLGNGLGDPFQGLYLPQDTARGGIFGLRHHFARDDRHAGLDVWFQYDPVRHDWRITEGRRYLFDLGRPGQATESISIVPGASLASFDIRTIPLVGRPSRARSLDAGKAGQLTANR